MFFHSSMRLPLWAEFAGIIEIPSFISTFAATSAMVFFKLVSIVMDLRFKEICTFGLGYFCKSQGFALLGARGAATALHNESAGLRELLGAGECFPTQCNARCKA